MSIMAVGMEIAGEKTTVEGVSALFGCQGKMRISIRTDNMIPYKIKDRATGKIYTPYEWALDRYKAGEHIIYCDLDCIVTDDENGRYLLDECGNYLWIDEDKWQVIRMTATEIKQLRIEGKKRWKEHVAKLKRGELP